MANRKVNIDSTPGGKSPNEPHAKVKFWLNEIEAARKREKDFRKEGLRIIEIYNGEKSDKTPYNILYSNTETLLPALYSATPRPVVTRRFKDEDPTGKAAATAGQRVLEFLLDTNIEGYETYDEAMQAATLDALLPGRGITCVKYDADVVDTQPDEQGADPMSYKNSELACLDTKSWNRVYFGYEKKWSKVPWVAFEEFIDKDEAVRLFGAEVANKIIYTDEDDRDNEDSKINSEGDKSKGERRVACIYQVWEKRSKQIYYVSAQYPDNLLKSENDPLGLTGFYPCPRPIKFVAKSNDLLPVALYCLYENQANELNNISRRINRVVTAIKAKALYDGELGDDIKHLLEADDNAFVPCEKSSSLAAEKGLQNAIWFMPIEELVNVLVQLYGAREQCKRVIYEITGLSDIIRGSTVASETATAQDIKSKWGTLRLKRLQKEIQRYARDLLRMMLEIAATKFSEETWAKMTGLPFILEPERLRLEQIAMAAQQSGQQLDPQTQEKLQAPVWGRVLEVLKDDMQRSYRIDIETNSTIEPEAAEDQKNIADLMNAIGQYLNGVAPLIAKGVMPFGVAQSMLLAITRRFRFGTEIEDYIKQMQEPKPDGDGGEEQAKQQQAQQQAQKAVQDASAKAMQSEIQMKQMQAEKAISEKQTALDVREIKLQSEEAIFKMQKEAASQSLSAKSDLDKTKLHHEQKLAQIQNSSIKNEGAVNKKADESLGKGVMAIQGTVNKLAQMQIQLLQTVAIQSAENKSILKAVISPRKRTPIRGADGRISEVIEEITG